MAKIKYRKVSKELLNMSALNVNVDNNRSSINSSFEVTEHYKIDINRLVPYAKQARKNFNEDDLIGLATSIKEHGIRQPLTVIHSKQDIGMYEVVSGERRLKAAKQAGLLKLPCIIISNEDEAEEIALIENIQRADLHPLELGEAFTSILRSRKSLSQRQLAEKLGISEKLVSENIQYTKLPVDIKNLLIDQSITNRDILRKLIKAENPMEFLQSKKSIKKINHNVISSVLRIAMKDGQFTIQSNAISKLPAANKYNLKIILQELVDRI